MPKTSLKQKTWRDSIHLQQTLCLEGTSSIFNKWDIERILSPLFPALVPAPISAATCSSWASTPAPSDENKKDVINRRNGQGPEHLKFFLLIFSKDETQAQSPSPRSSSPTHKGQGQALNKWASLDVSICNFFCSF